jgi:hypothetical protein
MLNNWGSFKVEGLTETLSSWTFDILEANSPTSSVLLSWIILKLIMKNRGKIRLLIVNASKKQQLHHNK